MIWPLKSKPKPSKHKPAVASPNVVQLEPSPWASDHKAVAYFGPVPVTLLRKPNQPLDAWLLEATAILQHRAWLLGANWIVGFECTIDPWEQKLHLNGTAAKLAPSNDSRRTSP